VKEIFLGGGLSVRLYDRMYSGEIRLSSVAGDVDFYVRQARITGGPVLELGAGTGRVAIPLANAGFAVTGLDLSPHMLRIAKRKVAALPPRGRIQFVRGDMRRFSLGRQFRLILIPFRAFQHLLTVEAQKLCLGCVRRHLAPGGRFIVDLFDPRLDLCHPGGRRAWTLRCGRDEVTGHTYRVRNLKRTNDPLRQLLREVWVYTEHGRRGRVIARDRELVELRWTYRYEMRHLLELCGFKIKACYGDFYGGLPRYGAEQVWVATK
jgi:SAM-dependent methyltransferase